METGANLVISALFNGPRLERIALQQSAYNMSLPSLITVLETISARLFSTTLLGEVGVTSGAATIGNEVIALMTAQSVLVNAYLSVLGGSSSSRVKSFVKYHMTTGLLNKIDTMKQYASYANSNIESDFGLEWQAHATYLTAAISAGKPFMVIQSSPLGPPI